MIYDLRTEYMTLPLGIDNAKPQLSWKLNPTEKNLEQKAYRIMVASSPEKIAEDNGDLWDSGKVNSSDETCIEYDGKKLKTGMQCFWKVMIWDKKNKPSEWSENAYWSMGIIEPDAWKANWIGFNQARDKAEKACKKDQKLHPPAIYMRKGFALKKPVRKAFLYASSLGNYEMHLNGQRIGEDYFTPGWTDYNTRIYYNTYDVTDLLENGSNAIGGILADGWYSGYVGFGSRRDHFGKYPRLSAMLIIEHVDGSQTKIVTNRTWKATTGPILKGDFLDGETYDARLEIPGWDTPGFNDSDWKQVNTTNKIKVIVEAYPSVTVKVFKELKPLSVKEPKKGNFVFDMGTNFAGFVRLKVKSRKGKKIIIKYAEKLNPDGTVYTANLRSAQATDTYICKGGGEEIWQPRFTFHGFQYVSVQGFSGTPGKDAITGIELTSSTDVVGNFKCSNSKLNQLYHNVCQTQRANFIDIPTDCPQRDERLGWTGDAQAYIRTAVLNMDVQSFFRKWLVDLSDAQFENGDFPKVAPEQVALGSGGPAWADAGIICPWAIYETYGDKRILEKHYDAMCKFMDYLHKSAPDYLAPEKFHCFGDWLNIEDPTSKELIYSAYHAGNATIMEKIATILGKKQDAKKFNKRFDDIKKAFNEAFIDKDGKTKDNSQTSYILPLFFDLVDGKIKKKVEANLIKRIEECNWHLSTGFVGTRDLMHVLSKIGRDDVAYRLLFNETFPSWLFPVKNGAKSIWERWNSWTPEDGFGDVGMNSFSHYAYGAVYQWICENIGGIKSVKPGFKEIVIKPCITDKLNWAETTYNSIHGEIRVYWKRQKEKVNMEVTVPPNVKAKIYVPGKKKPVAVGSGNYTF